MRLIQADNYREFGNTGLKVPPVIFGTSALGNLYTSLTFETKCDIVKENMSYIQGPVIFDSAGKYGAGLALEMLGKCLDALHVDPSQVIISNKLGWKRIPLTAREPSFEPGVWMDLENDAIQDLSYDGIMRCFEQGNELLGGMYLPQLVSVHDPDEYLAQATSADDRKQRYATIISAYKALFRLKAEGRVKAVGIGAKDWKIIREISSDIQLDWVMFANSLTIMHHPPELLEFMELLHKQGTGIINSAVFHAGFLIGGSYFDYKLIKPDTPENLAIFKWRENFIGLCKKHDVKPAVACVNFAMTVPGVVSISLNTSNPRHVKENVESVVAHVPAEFYADMLRQGLIAKDYPYLEI